jgi:hypothetical protein
MLYNITKYTREKNMSSFITKDIAEVMTEDITRPNRYQTVPTRHNEDYYDNEAKRSYETIEEYLMEYIRDINDRASKLGLIIDAFVEE